MSYSDFTSFEQLVTLGISQITTVEKLIDFEPISPSPFLTEALKRFAPLAIAINTEKARSEYLIAPILSEIVTLNPHSSLFSGKSFTADASLGLNGFVDFLLTGDPNHLTIKAPIVTVIEAKNENINDGLAQCIATMYGALLVNQRDPNIGTKTVYGCVTTGQVWRFLALTPDLEVLIDLKDRYLTPIDEVLGLLNAFITV
ncbi:hypothetical protein [Limnofasciculus baicalensis]|uniref:Uncharacterized protein n=1 Tax=Limnofasciculus baicalensis BBK-W-15 TaxID=2699891 RepID=A0AAE3GVH0_9CYAN|nr:hypothetical protein [Limnofasciculus baicalensis]MCP2730812.1 hypothetical protein [Limnofasciculus baicalensis BBK-W-15]